MKLETPRLKLGANGDYYTCEGNPWICAKKLKEVFAAFEPVAGDIMLVGSSQRTTGSVKVIIDLDSLGTPLWAMPSWPNEKEGLYAPLERLVRRFFKAGYRTVYLTLYEFK